MRMHPMIVACWGDIPHGHEAEAQLSCRRVECRVCRAVGTSMPKISTTVKRTFPDFAGEFAKIENETGGWIARLRTARKGVREGEVRAEAEQQNNAQFLAAIYLGGIAVRVRELAEAVVSLVNKGNPHAAAPVARALFETCCVPI